MKHVAIALIYRDHQLCVAERLSEPFKGYIECPGGKVEPNESIFAALRRELYEECGLAHFDAYTIRTLMYPMRMVNFGFIGSRLNFTKNPKPSSIKN